MKRRLGRPLRDQFGNRGRGRPQAARILLGRPRWEDSGTSRPGSATTDWRRPSRGRESGSEACPACPRPEVRACRPVSRWVRRMIASLAAAGEDSGTPALQTRSASLRSDAKAAFAGAVKNTVVSCTRQEVSCRAVAIKLRSSSSGDMVCLTRLVLPAHRWSSLGRIGQAGEKRCG